MLSLVCAKNNNDEFIIAEKFGTMGALSVGLEESGTGHAIGNLPIFAATHLRIFVSNVFVLCVVHFIIEKIVSTVFRTYNEEDHRLKIDYLGKD